MILRVIGMTIKVVIQMLEKVKKGHYMCFDSERIIEVSRSPFLNRFLFPRI